MRIKNITKGVASVHTFAQFVGFLEVLNGNVSNISNKSECFETICNIK